MSLGNKEIMANNIKKMMKSKGVNNSIVCADLNIPMATFSDWCNAKTYPRIDKIEMMANYFGCTKSDLVEEWNDIAWTPQTQEITQPNAYYLDDCTIEYAQFLFENPEYRVLFDASRKVKPEDLQKALKAIGIFIDE